jgi:voltage-gated potassium channel
MAGGHTLTPEQTAAQARWQQRWNLPILFAAFVPLFVTSPDSRWVEVVVGVGSWIVFVIDLYIQRRIVPGYLRQPSGLIDLGIVLLTFPYYLIPGVAGGSAILLLARLGRVARVFMATHGLRQLAARLGKVAVIAGTVLVICSLAAYEAEHPTNTEYATVGDSFWWGIVTLTTVGYGDITPKTRAGRFAGVVIMFTGIAVLGVLAGSLASLFNLEERPQETSGSDDERSPPRPVHEELAALQAQLRTVEQRLGELAEQARG